MKSEKGRKLFYRLEKFKDAKGRMFTIETVWWKGRDQGTIEFIEDSKEEVLKMPSEELRSLFDSKKLELI